ncbi:MAG: NifB/NifX family molybdenum-iron cluster-binding protein [Deltaproteobacteria bacterium]|nr:NifB/NifX family molybdenum-iron cluster-binding protein [Deltaproteobacteria bacterium]
MKLAIPANGPHFDAEVSERLGASSYLLVVDLESKNFESIRTPRDPGSGSGMQMVALIIAKKIDILLTKWCSPVAEKYLSASGVKILTGIGGTVAEALEKFEKDNLECQIQKMEHSTPTSWKISRRVVTEAVRSASKQIRNLLPVMIGVVFLVGLFSAFISKESLASFFSGSIWKDSLWGASVGSMLAGNPINSYIIGGQLLEIGVSLIAVTAFICSWVSVGLLQLPAEIDALGWKFAVVRNLSCFGLSMAIGFVMILVLDFFGM